MKARWKSMLGAANDTTTTTSAITTSGATTATGTTTSIHSGSFQALATTVRQGAAAAAAATRPGRYFFPSEDEAHDNTTSGSSSGSSPSFILPSPCPLTERSPPTGADNKAAANFDDRDAQGDADQAIEPDCRYWYIHGRAFNLSGFMDQHPGGPAALELARGRDCTALFESYHPFSDKPGQLLPKFLVPSAPVPPSFAQPECGDAFFVSVGPGDDVPYVRDPFWEALRRDCGAYLAQHNVGIAMGWPFFLLGLAMMGVQAAIYWYGFRHGSYPAAFALGLASWLVAGTFGHEGLHYGISRRFPWLNHALGYVSMFAMCNPTIWTHQHTYSHHSFTNDHRRDPDTHHFERMLRMHFAYPHSGLHRMLVHRLWVLSVWSLAQFGSTIVLPIKALATDSIQGATSLRTLSWRGRLDIVLHTVLFFLVLWILPYRTMRQAKMAALGLESAPLVMPDLVLRMCCLFTCFQTTLGAFFGVFTQCTHLTLESMAAASRTDRNGSWARTQVETAANFAEASTFWFIFSGGLNLQIEHHLFPGISHGALRKLTPIIRRTCQDHGVHFKSYPTFGALLDAVLEYFARLASAEQPAAGGKAKGM